MSGFHGNVTNNEIFDLNRKGNQNFSINQEELPHERITVAIRLSTEESQHHQRRACAISARFRNFDTSTILAIAKKHDSDAVED